MSCRNCAHGETENCDACGIIVCEYCARYDSARTLCTKCIIQDQPIKTLGCGKHVNTPLNKVPLSYLIMIQNSTKVSQRVRETAWGEVKRRRDNASKRLAKKNKQLQISAESREAVSTYLLFKDESNDN